MFLFSFVIIGSLSMVMYLLLGSLSMVMYLLLVLIHAQWRHMARRCETWDASESASSDASESSSDEPESSSDESGFVASSSSSTKPGWSYDVFLSFRGPDTRQGIVAELYDQLNNTRGVKTFKDDTDLEVGDAISPTLLAAVEQSRFAIVVLSERYAASTWCLEELVKICQCMQDKRILPIFYRVNPADVRYQKQSFEIAFQKHEKSWRHTTEKVKQWRDALNKVASLSGWHTQNYKTERELVDAIMEFVCRKVLHASVLSTGDFCAFKATRLAMNKVMEALKDDKITVISVHGIGGVGKTTLVEYAGQKAHNQGLFNHVIKVVVSQTLDLRKVQGTLADGLGITLIQESEAGRASRLKQEIINRKKVLIIVDDVWERVELASIGVPSYDMLQCCNSKVIFTTRIWNVCHVMGSHENVTLSVLSEEDSWDLFVKNARRSFEPIDFEQVAKKVASECRGLPVALIAVARALGDKDIQEWNKAARRLEKSQTANPDDKGDASKCIRLSYDYLKTKDYKTCFLLCCLFPEDSTIEVKHLFKYAIGIGLFRDAETFEEARGTANSVVNFLINSSLLMSTKLHACVQMHDVIRDTAIQIAESEEGFLVKARHGLTDWHRLHKDYTTITLMGNFIRKLPDLLVFPKLQILILRDNIFLNEIPETFFQSLQELRVLDLSGTGISLLPQSLGLLTNLQVFLLDHCLRLINISIVRKLEKLQILSMSGSITTKEGLKDIGNLTSVRILNLNRGSRGRMYKIPLGVLSKLITLEELYIDGFGEWRVEGDGQESNASFEEVTSLSNLRVLQAELSGVDCLPNNVELSPNWVEFYLCIGRFVSCCDPPNYGHNAIVLSLDGTMSSLPSWFLNAVMNRADRLDLELSHGRLIDMFSGYDQGLLHRLKYLFVRGPGRGLSKMINTKPTSWVPKPTSLVPKQPVFKNLEELILDKLDCGFCFSKLLSEPLVNLKLLKIEKCTNWGDALLPSNLLQRLPNLRKVSCAGVDEICTIFGCEGIPEAKPSKLIELRLKHLDALRSICDGPAPPAMFQALKSLDVYNCKLLGSLFSHDAAQYLSQLVYMSIDLCPLLERIIEAKNKRVVLPKLRSLMLSRLPKLYCRSTIDIECPSLVNLHLEGCSSVSILDFRCRKPLQFDEFVARSLSDCFHD